ncbi:MAG: DUF4296 domain-containing protein [Bacteroidetes bacterium]|nr:DUF4296 domain-containing protein [Bacteroidota bacterium]
MIFTARIRIAILCCLLVTGCREKKDLPGSPVAISADSLITPEKMVLILADVHVVEASFLLDRNNGKVSKDRQDDYYKGIFKKYHISPGRYDENLAFYRSNPENYAKMYEKVVVLLENRQEKFSGKK